MGMLENLEPDDRQLYREGFVSGDYNQDLYIKRSLDDGSNKTKIYLSAFTRQNGEIIQQGFLYFYLDEELMSSDFIGIKVEEQYRNLNIASFLVASWIDLCKNNGYEFLGANEKQRKPFLLYLLKTYGFEIFDKSLYDTRPDVITICRSTDMLDKRKFLLFRDPKHEKVFMGTNVYKTDNYEIAHSGDGLILLDKVLLPLQNSRKSKTKYELWDEIKAELKANEVINRHKR